MLVFLIICIANNPQIQSPETVTTMVVYGLLMVSIKYFDRLSWVPLARGFPQMVVRAATAGTGRLGQIGDGWTPLSPCFF